MRVGPSSQKSMSSLRAARAALLVLAAAVARCLTGTSSLPAWTCGLGFVDVRLRLTTPLATPTAAAMAKVVPWGQLIQWHGLRLQRRGVARRAQTDPRHITTCIRKARSVQEVLSLLRQELENPNLNYIHISAALVRLAKEQDAIDDEVQQSPLLEGMVVKLQDWLRKGSVGSRETANIFWAVAKLEKVIPRLMELMPDLVDMAKLVVCDMNSRDISNLIYASALCELDPALLQDLLPLMAERAWYLSQDWNAQDVANIFWASATLKQREPTSSSLVDLMPVLMEKASTLVRDMTPQEVSNIMWASAVLHHFEASLEFDDMMKALAAAVIEQVPRWRAKEWELSLSMIACALGKLKVMDKPLLRVIAKRSANLVPRMNPWGLCALSWTFNEALQDAEFRGFQKQLASEVQRRGLSTDMVQRSQLGPDVWFHEFPSERAR